MQHIFTLIRSSSAFAGFLFAVALQSATAVALIVASFSAAGYVLPAIGVATLLGADFGSAFVVRILRYDLSLLVPVLLLAGPVAFRASEARGWRQLGRILFGLGLLLLSLRLIGEASEPLAARGGERPGEEGGDDRAVGRGPRGEGRRHRLSRRV